MGQSSSFVSKLWGRTNFSESEEQPRIESPEAETIRRAKQGDAAAFEHIYQLHSQRIYALCLRIVRNPIEAEDLTQEAFMLVFRKIQTFRGESAFTTWLYRLALNVVLMQLRKNNLRPTSLEAEAREYQESGEPGMQIVSTDSKQAGLIDCLHLKRAVEQLPVVRKIVFVLHDVQGYKHREIAKMMDCSVGTSKGQLHRARKQLRNLLRANCDSLSMVSRSAGQGDECAISC
jgi:RNA polymerase sigma-70 factor (ECF subfamily)